MGNLKRLEAAEDNPPDVVKVDVPMIIRLLEWAREEAEADVPLHIVAENLVKLSKSGKVITMDDYGAVLEGTETDDE